MLTSIAFILVCHCLLLVFLQRDEQMQRLKRVQEYQQRKLQDKISADDQVSEPLRCAKRVLEYE